MTDTKKDGSDDKGRAADPSGKKPYATLDLKATEIKVTSIAGNETASAAASSSAQSSSAAKPEATPRPASAASYATANPAAASAGAAAAPKAESKPGTSDAAAKPASADKDKPAAKPAAASDASSAGRPAAPAAAAPVTIIKKRGGFFSHLAAGVAGGALALAAYAYAPQLGLAEYFPKWPDATSGLEQRLAAFEKKISNSDSAAKLQAAETRIAALEKSAEALPSLREAQTRLAADTKAALASAASDAGAPEQITRLAALEQKIKDLADAGANDPNAGRVAQLAALTGKVADLENALSTQLTAVRKGVAEDVDARFATVAAAAEAAKSGTQRIDRDIATVKSDAVRLTERITAMKTDDDKQAEAVKMAHEQLAKLSTAIDGVKGSAAKPADVASAIAPVTQKIAAIEQSLQSVMKTEDDRRSSAERVVLSLELQNLKRVLDRGQKYDAELAEVQKTAGNKADLTPLIKYKDQGVTPTGELVRDFNAQANAAIDAAAEPGDGSVMGKLISGAKSIVRVRKVSHNPDDMSAEAIVSRMEEALKEGRLGDVLDQAKALPQKSKDAIQAFLDKVAARQSVDAALASLESQLKTSLSAVPAPAAKSVQ
jgi:hypothetical protein